MNYVCGLTFNLFSFCQDATWEPVISEGVGVSDNSEDEDPLSVPAKKPSSSYQSFGDPDIIAITPEVDADGAPILSQLSQLPIASRVSPATQGGTVPVLNGTAKSKADSDFISDHELAPEDDFVDLNFSIKFFQFIRTAPEKPVPPVVEAVTEPSELPPPSTVESPVVPPLIIAKPKPPPAKPAAKPRGGGAKAPRGRPRGGGGSAKAKRYDTDEYSSDEEPKKKKAKRGGGRSGGGGGAARGRGGGGGARKPRYRDSSHEESSESEEEVLKRPVVSSTGRPSRNCRRSTNYADIEKAGDVLDYLLN